MKNLVSSVKPMPTNLLEKYDVNGNLGPLVYVSYIDVNGEKDYTWIDLCSFETYEEYVSFCDYLCLDDSDDMNLSFVDIPEVLQVRGIYDKFTFDCVRDYFFRDDEEKDIWRLFMEHISGRPVSFAVADEHHEGIWGQEEYYADELYGVDPESDGMSRKKYQKFLFSERVVLIEGHVFTRWGC